MSSHNVEKGEKSVTLKQLRQVGAPGKRGWTRFSQRQSRFSSSSSSFLFHSHVYLGRSGNHQGGEQRGSGGLQTGGQVDELLDDHHHHLDLHQLHCHQHPGHRNLHTRRVAIFNVWVNQSRQRNRFNVINMFDFVNFVTIKS